MNNLPPMSQWPPDAIYLLTGLLAALTGAAAEARQHKRISKWDGMLAAVIYGATGAALGMLGYQWAGGDKHPERIVAIGMLVGLRLITTQQIKRLVSALLNLGNGKSDDNDSKNV